MSGLGIIAQEEDGTCELCGRVEELRPYGANYECICFDCAMENQELTKQRFDEYVLGKPKMTIQ
jgi:hypothetical protein